jgi:hypothetical protein
MYGTISRNSDGMGTLSTERRAWSESANPNTRLARNAPMGVQPPKIIAARPMKPRPAVMSRSNRPVCPRMRNAPPTPATMPPRITLMYRVRTTSIPAVSAAFGCSPTARTRRPQRVRNSPTWISATRPNIANTNTLFVNRIGPRMGISDRIGRAMGGRRWGALSEGISVSTRADRKAVMPAAKMLMTKPAMIWSTL